MAGSFIFQLSGQVSYVMDKATQYGGQIRIRVSVATEHVGMKAIPAHSVFVSVKYDSKDTNNARFNMLKAQLQKGMHVFLRGNIKPQPATDKYPATHFLDVNWRDVMVSGTPFPKRNKVFFEGEVLATTSSEMQIKYSYMNPKETDQSKKWNDRIFTVYIMSPVSKNPRDNVFFEGRLFGLDPDTKQEIIYMIADEVF